MKAPPPFVRIEWCRIYDEQMEEVDDWLRSSLVPPPLAVIVLYSAQEEKTATLVSCCGWSRSTVEKICREVDLSVYVGIEEQVEIMLRELNRRLRNDEEAWQIH